MMTAKNSKEDVFYARAALLIKAAMDSANKKIKLAESADLSIEERIAARIEGDELRMRAEALDSMMLEIKGVSVLTSLSDAAKV